MTVQESLLQIQACRLNTPYHCHIGKYGIDLRANEEYHIILAVKVGDTGFYGKSRLSSTTIEGVDIDFKASKYST